MEYTIEKFIKYLNGRMLYLMNNIMIENNLNKTHTAVANNMQILTNSDYEIEMTILENLKLFFRLEKDSEGILFKDFEFLSKELIKSKLPEDECIFIIFYLIKKNLNNDILSSRLINTIDISLINADDFKTLSNDDLTKEKIIYNNLIVKDNKTRRKELEWTNEQIQEFEKVKNKYVTDISDVKENHLIIKENYFDKKKTFDKNNIKNVIESLKKLDIVPQVLEMIENSLNLELNNRIQKEQYKTSFKKNKVSFNKNLIPNNKNYNQMVTNLNNMVNLRDMMPKDYYTLNQIIEIVSWMIKLNTSQEEIIKFLWNTEIFNQNRDIHIITKYLELYDKLKYYENKLVLFDELKNMEEYFQSLFITNDEDYEFWKNCLEEELTNYLKFIPGGYMYEINTARKKIKYN